MLSEDWELKMERAALQGAVDGACTLGPFVQEMIDDATAELDKTEEEIADVEKHSKVNPIDIVRENDS